MKIEAILNEILKSITEPFISEADFQFWLAWQLKTKISNAEILLEYPSDEEKSKYYDIAIKKGKEISFIELKYKTREAIISRHDINLKLKGQGARDLGNYLFLKDIERMENTSIKNNIKNYCIMLTNDYLYWNPSHRSTLDEEFKLTGIKTGTKIWKNITQDGHWTEKYPPIKLCNTYTCNWQEINLQDILFKYLLFEITTNK